MLRGLQIHNMKMQITDRWQGKSPMRLWLSGLLFLFLIAHNTLAEVSSLVLTFFLLTWLVLLVQKRINHKTDFNANLLIAGFTIYYAVNVLSFIVHGLTTDLYVPRSSHLDNELRMLSVVPLYFLMRQYKPAQWIFWYGLAFGAIICGVSAVDQVLELGIGFRATGAAYHSIGFASFALVMGFMALSGLSYFNSQHKYLTIIPIIAFICGSAAAILSQSRGVWLSFPFFIILLLWQYRKNSMLLWLSVAAVIAAGVTFMMPGNPLLHRTLQAINEVEVFMQGDFVGGGADTRLVFWQVAWDIFKEYPLLGLGQGSFMPVLSAKVAQGEVPVMVEILKEPHNIFLNGMVNSGILGLLAVILCFVSPLVIFIRHLLMYNVRGRSLAYAGIVLVGCFFHFSLTESLFQRNMYINFYLIILAYIISQLHILALKLSGDSNLIRSNSAAEKNTCCP